MDFNQIYIDGAWTEPETTERIQVEDPVEQRVLAEVPACKEADVNRAIAAAKSAFEDWKDTPISDRIHYLEAARDELKKDRDAILDILMKEQGVNRNYGAKAHVDPHLSDIDRYIDIAKAFPFEEKKDDLIIRKEPLGVVGAITPWNYPMGQIMTKIIPGLLAGATFVLKPSRQTPLTAYYIVDAFHRAGLPKGVLNLVPGRGGEVGNVLASSEDVAMISFTGSTKGGLEVNKLAAETGKKVVLEMGGKSASILLDREHIDLAVKKTLSRVYQNVGQTCSAWTRLIVSRELKEEVEAALVRETKNYTFANPREGERNIGPLASKKQYDKVTGYIKRGLEEGATLLVGDTDFSGEDYHVGPVIFTDVDNKMSIAQEEIFGPVLVVICYESIEEAIAIANDSIYGLSGAVFGKREEAVDVARKMDTGEIVINGKFSKAQAPFGGYKYSGLGREKGYYGFIEYLQTKAIHLGE